MPINLAVLASVDKIDGANFLKTLLFLLAMYYVIKWAVRSGIEEAYHNLKSPSVDEEDE